MARTNAAHLSGNDLGTKSDIDVKDAALDQEIGVQESGNTVGLAEELSKSGEIKRQYDLNTSLVSSFNRHDADDGEELRSWILCQQHSKSQDRDSRRNRRACASCPKTSPTPARPATRPAPIPIAARRSPSAKPWIAPMASPRSTSRSSVTDESKFITEYDPSNPAADEKGMVKLPNVNMLVEMADMREANRSYDANLQTIKQIPRPDLRDDRSTEEPITMINNVNSVSSLSMTRGLAAIDHGQLHGLLRCSKARQTTAGFACGSRQHCDRRREYPEECGRHVLCRHQGHGHDA